MTPLFSDGKLATLNIKNQHSISLLSHSRSCLERAL